MNKTFLFLFTALLSVYGLYLWREKQRPPTFRAELLKIDPLSVTGIELRLPEGFDEHRFFSLLRSDGQWIASVDLLNMPADTAAVGRLVRVLTSLETTQLVGQFRPASNRFGLGEDQHLFIRLRTQQGQEESIYLGWQGGRLPSPDSLVYVRLKGQQEVYGIPASRLLPAPMRLQDFNLSRLCSLQESDLEALLLESPDTTVRCFRELDGGWRCNGRLFAPDSLNRYFGQLSSRINELPASGFDELYIQTRLRRALILYPRYATDSVVIAAYYEPARAKPWLINSSQYPAAWFESDEAGLYQQIFLTLDSLFQ
jgi:hypothetical protein